MGETNQPYSPEREGASEKLLGQIIDYCGENKITSEELTHAYYSSLDPDKKYLAEELGSLPNPRQEVLALTQMIDDLTKREGLPLDYIQELIAGLSGYEKTAQNYYRLVDSLPLSANEKRVLKSIVAEERKGTLTVSTKNGQDLYSVYTADIFGEKGSTQANLALTLAGILAEAAHRSGVQIEINFEAAD
ncbi:MAG: hypothetical protein UY92_C0006G0129 [Candidatus Magasanikbacteria bacterium GW2011_GWA2_56_11]|uniref:Uncharacterized protein n=1 Tax=Candidatus Magasanikbacteria bacterium GW2011_GWA2_56_11 TaxID=1619044 RepID=A0A0G1YGJ8_9BACT|nr:MAG: hypothetical protein UY92_C0006G0129 [Candidatus Magasanikbacteria bacterium GW2011_GWA2_56_11]